MTAEERDKLRNQRKIENRNKRLSYINRHEYLLKQQHLLYEDQYKLNEGLITSTNIEITYSIISKYYDVLFDKHIKDSFIVNLLLINEKQLDNLMQLTNNLGWFCNTYIINNNEEKYDKNDILKKIKNNNGIKISFVFEAKFLIEVNGIPKKLYHFTTYAKLNKILDKGLCPASHEKVAYHPDRIYLCKRPSYSEINLLPKLCENDNTQKKIEYENNKYYHWVLLEIDTSKIPSYFKLFYDCTYIDGYFTYNNIPPNAINEINQYLLNDNYEIIIKKH